MMRLARAMVRLYPSAWRARYEDEVLALVEQTGLGPGRAIDLLRGAVREWWRDSLRPLHERPRSSATVILMTRLALLAAALSGVATIAAVWLSQHATPPPTTWIENGHTVIAPPGWPGRLGYAHIVVFVLALARSEFLRHPSIHEAPVEDGISTREFITWLLAIGASSVLYQWVFLVFMNGTGYPSFSPSTTWGSAMMFDLLMVQLLYMVSRSFRESERRRRSVHLA